MRDPPNGPRSRTTEPPDIPRSADDPNSLAREASFAIALVALFPTRPPEWYGEHAPGQEDAARARGEAAEVARALRSIQEVLRWREHVRLLDPADDGAVSFAMDRAEAIARGPVRGAWNPDAPDPTFEAWTNDGPEVSTVALREWCTTLDFLLRTLQRGTRQDWELLSTVFRAVMPNDTERKANFVRRVQEAIEAMLREPNWQTDVPGALNRALMALFSDCIDPDHLSVFKLDHTFVAAAFCRALPKAPRRLNAAGVAATLALRARAFGVRKQLNRKKRLETETEAVERVSKIFRKLVPKSG